MLKGVGRCFRITFSLMFFHVAAALAGSDVNVLLLNSYHHGMDWTDGETKGIQAILDHNTLPINLHVEYMDTKRFRDDEHIENLHKLFAHKFHNVHFSAILATDNDAFNFLRRYRDDIFGEVPVVFTGVNFFNDDMLANVKGFTGVAETFEAGQTIQLMKQLYPQVRRIVVIVDKTTTGLAIRKELEPQISPFAGQLSFEYWDSLTLSELKEQLNGLSSDTLVLLLPYAKDSSGEFVTYGEIANLVSRNSPVPVFGTWDFYMGYGIVGGRLTNAENQGRAAAELLVKLFDGANINDLPVTRVAPSEFQFDARQLKRFGISKNSLPNESRMLFRTWYEIYWAWVWSGATALIAFLWLFWGWLHNARMRFRAEKARREIEERYRLILLNSPTGIFHYDTNLVIKYCNQRFAEIVDAPHERLVGLDMKLLKDKRILPALEQSAKGNQCSYEGEYLTNFSQKTIWVSMICSPLMSDDGFQYGAVGIVEDITERKRSEIALENAKNAAEQASQAKSIFLTTLSHEIRTPLNGILGMAQFLVTPNVGETERIEFGNVILSSGKSLLGTLNEILDYSKIVTGGLELESLVFSPSQMLQAIQVKYANAAATKGLELEAIWYGSEQKMYEGDTNRLMQMLSNYISNALKFTHQGSVRIEARDFERQENKAMLEFSVTDTGIGIDADKQSLLFSPFTQLDSSISRNFEGAGLGLSIVKHLALQMGGSVGVESTIGKGSRFWFRVYVECN